MRKPSLSTLVAVLGPTAALAVVLATVSIPAYSLGPGPAREVGSRIEFDGPERHPSEGRFVLTSVSVERVTVFEAIGAWLDPARSVVRESALLAPGESEEEGERRSISEMDQSKIDAVAVVLDELTRYPEEHGRGVLVESVAEGCPAHGRLFPGDVIEAIDGRAVTSLEEFGAIVDAAAPGRALLLRVDADGETERVRLTPRRCLGSHEPLIGIVPIEAFPFPVSISSGAIGGPSAGLMWALGLYDLLTPGDLTGGRVVAGTGDIDLEGAVGPIGGIEQKLLAAEAAGAELFVLPQANLDEARRVGTDLPLVPVSTVLEAVAALEAEA